MNSHRVLNWGHTVIEYPLKIVVIFDALLRILWNAKSHQLQVKHATTKSTLVKTRALSNASNKQIYPYLNDIGTIQAIHTVLYISYASQCICIHTMGTTTLALYSLFWIHQTACNRQSSHHPQLQFPRNTYIYMSGGISKQIMPLYAKPTGFSIDRRIGFYLICWYSQTSFLWFLCENQIQHIYQGCLCVWAYTW